ncbi:hemerythrin domain-containing protein [Marixanthomonas spongiae]|uniref:Cation-binding protein n=1 Tax=Marixanthomonas spongiae TaxID=2174845 RepID=A0A2U0HUR5_9FLAO|nr:hemerythrin domain-containing protein [Marixanthomonas spongiae]PVW12612.1 cation-binding protein [Marixanthomonas spongiae]
MKKPPKRDESLEPISDEHYNLLMFGWKISEAMRNNIETERIKAYADWFKEKYLEPHTEIEKKHVFPILGMDNVRVKKAMANHRRLLRLFNDTTNVYKSLNRIEEEIGRYIRFEERILYNEIQAVATKKQLQDIKKHHEAVSFSDKEWKDKFWIA